MIRATTIATAWLLAACSSVPKRDARELAPDLPEQWASTESSSSSIPDRWWEGFGDEALSKAVAESLGSNPNLEIATARLEAAWAQARIAGADLTPSVSLGTGASRNAMNLSQFGFDLPSTMLLPDSFISERFNLSLSARWELDLWGRVRAGNRAAIADARAETALLSGAFHSLAGQVAKAWMASIEARQQERLAKETVELYRLTSERIEARFQAGVRSSLDLRLSNASFAGSQAVLSENLAASARSMRRLEILLGRYPDNTLELSTALPSLPPEIPGGVPVEIISRRPDLVAAEQTLFAADARLARAKASLYPQLSLTASGGSSTRDLSDLVSGGSRVWSLAANLVQPIFQGGRLRAGVDLRQANVRQAVAAFEADVLTALEEVETALDTGSRLAEVEAHLKETLDQSKAASDLAMSRYEQGLENIITLLESRRRAIEAESRWLGVRRRRLDNRIDLHLALGGGFNNSNHPASRKESIRN